ncbi:MAG: hypothetical protein V7739_15675 [Motiliproteus sp.]
MGQRSDELVHQAEFLLKLFGDQGAQKATLLAIEKELKSRGEHRNTLYRKIDSLCKDDGVDPQEYRCRYHPALIEQHPLDEHFFDVTH